MKAESAVKAPRAKWQRTITYSKLLLYPWSLISLAALIILGVIEFKSPTARTFFGDYPVTFGLIAGVLNLIFTLSVVNRIIQRRDELRWRDIKNTTLKGLNDEVRATRDILWVALFGQPPFGPNKQTDAACESAHQDRRLGWPETPFGDVGAKKGNARAQLDAMEGNLAWTQTAAIILRMATQEMREGLVRWAPMMALARGDYKVLVPVTRLADVLEVMEFPFADNRTDNGKSCLRHELREPLRELWLHAITMCVYAEENIVDALYPKRDYPERGPDAWISKEPRERMLSRDQLADLDLWLGQLRHPVKSRLRHPVTFLLGHARTFKKDTRNRSYAVTTHVEWPW